MHLLLLRHAKSSSDDEEVADHDRPLDARGERAASLMGAYLAQRGAMPQLALCSTARRAVQTLERVLAQLPTAPETRFAPALYLAEPGDILAELRGNGGASDPVLMVGHNPGMAVLARALAGRGDPGALKRLAEKFPTAALAVLRFDIRSWSEAANAGGELLDYRTPKDLV